jgi:hypothetical protein
MDIIRRAHELWQLAGEPATSICAAGSKVGERGITYGIVRCTGAASNRERVASPVSSPASSVRLQPETHFAPFGPALFSPIVSRPPNLLLPIAIALPFDSIAKRSSDGPVLSPNPQ